MFIVRHLKTGQYSTKGGWTDKLQEAHAWTRKQSASCYASETDYDRKSPTFYRRLKVGEVVEVHIVIGPDPNAPAPPPSPPKKKGKGKIEAQAQEQASSDAVPEWWKDVAGDQVDTDIPA